MNKVLTGATLMLALSLAPPSYAEDDQTRISGTLEVELAADTIAPPTAELAITHELGKYVAAELVILYEDGVTGLDTAAMTLSPEDSNWSLSAGMIYMPFGNFDSAMISDPLTLSLGETQEAAIRYDYSLSNLSGSFYLFNGSNNVGGQAALDNFGLKLTHASEFMTTSFGYIDDIGDSDALQAAIFNQLTNNNTSAKVAGQSIALGLRMGAISINSEMISAVTAFQSGQVEAGAVQPMATSTELAYGFDIAGSESIVAIGAQTSRDANALGIPKSRLMLGLSSDLQKDTRLGLQFSQDTDYGSVVTTSYAVKLTASF